jgi:hypothetical protein
VAAGVSLSVSGVKAVLNLTTGYFYYDTAITGPARLMVSLLTNANATLYNVS